MVFEFNHFWYIFEERPEVLPTTGSTPDQVPQTVTEMVQTIVTSESGNSSTNFDSGSNVLPIGIIIGIGSLTVFVLLMIIMHAFLKYLRGISTVQNVTEASGDVYMEISDNMILGQGDVSNEANVCEDREMSVIEQSGSSNNGLASAEESITDYVYSEVGKKPMHEEVCSYKPIKSEDPKMNFTDNPDTYCESSEIQKMDESDQSGFLDDTPPVHIVNVVNNAEENMADYVYSEVNKKQMHELTCDYRSTESEEPKLNLTASQDMYYDSSDIQEMDVADKNGFHNDTPTVQSVDEEETSKGISISDE